MIFDRKNSNSDLDKYLAKSSIEPKENKIQKNTHKNNTNETKEAILSDETKEAILSGVKVFYETDEETKKLMREHGKINLKADLVAVLILALIILILHLFPMDTKALLVAIPIVVIITLILTSFVNFNRKNRKETTDEIKDAVDEYKNTPGGTGITIDGLPLIIGKTTLDEITTKYPIFNSLEEMHQKGRVQGLIIDNSTLNEDITKSYKIFDTKATDMNDLNNHPTYNTAILYFGGDNKLKQLTLNINYYTSGKVAVSPYRAKTKEYSHQYIEEFSYTLSHNSTDTQCQIDEDNYTLIITLKDYPFIIKEPIDNLTHVWRKE